MTSYDDLDAQIEAALAEEPWRPAPKGLYARIDTTLRVERARQSARKQMITRVGMAFVGGVGVIAGGVVLNHSVHAVARALRFIPGGMGQFDHALSAFSLGPSPILVVLAVLAAVVPMTATAFAAGAVAHQARRLRIQ